MSIARIGVAIDRSLTWDSGTHSENHKIQLSVISISSNAIGTSDRWMPYGCHTMKVSGKKISSDSTGKHDGITWSERLALHLSGNRFFSSMMENSDSQDTYGMRAITSFGQQVQRDEMSEYNGRFSSNLPTCQQLTHRKISGGMVKSDWWIRSRGHAIHLSADRNISSEIGK